MFIHAHEYRASSNGTPSQWVREGTILSHSSKAIQGRYGIKLLSKRWVPEDLAEASNYYSVSELIAVIGISIQFSNSDQISFFN